jgi:integrase
VAARTQSPKTLERYGELIRNQIDPHLGSLKVRNLRAEPVRAWCVKLLDQGFAPRTIGHAHRLLRTALVPVVREDVLTRYGLPKVEAEKIEILSEDQVFAVLKALEGHSLYPIVSLALLTGMRRGELLGLQWGDVDLDGATLRVERAVEETKAGLRLKPPKTKRGRRSISLPAEAVTMLRAHKVAQKETRLVLAQGPIKPETLVFSNVEGALLRLRNVTKAWWRIVTAHDLPHVNFHSLRHTHVSMPIRAGVDILTISRRLGHSKAAITLDVYGHLIGGADAAAAKALEGLLK